MLLKWQTRGQGGEALQVLEEGQAGDSGKATGAPVRLAFSRKNLVLAGAVLAASLVFFLLSGNLVWEDPPTGRLPIHAGFVMRYGLLALVSGALCLVEWRMPHVLQCVLGWGMLLAAPLAAFYVVDLINGVDVSHFPLRKALANYLCYALLFSLLYALTRRVWAALLAGGVVALTFAIANHFVVEFRGQPILPWDFQSIGTAMAVSGGYEYLMTPQMAFSVPAFLGVVVLSAKIGPQGGAGTAFRTRLAERLVPLAGAVLLGVLLFPAHILPSLNIEVWAWNQKVSSERTGLLAGFVENVQYVMVEKPAGYSKKAVQALGGEAGAQPAPGMLGAPGKQPTVIAIMNESMTDFARTGGLALEPDNMPYIHALQESGEVIWGTAYSSVFGGNTCNSEYEFLTGNTTAFLPAGSKPYQQYVDHDQLALPAIMKSHGYRTLAIHPARAKNWSRDVAYPYLGFDEFMDMDGFDVLRRLEHSNTSDLSNYKQVIYSYEHRGEEPLFLFNITIQNHGGFKDETYETTIRLAEEPGKYPETEQYLSLTKKSDEALEYLLGYFEKQEEPVVILFFGDHWPSLEEGFIEEMVGADMESMDIAQTMQQYEVPFFIWANYPLEAQEIGGVSINYLSGLLLRAAGLEGTAYTNFLEELRQSVPVVTAVGTIDKEGQVYENGDATPYDDLLQDYAILQYNHAFGGKGREDGIFTR
mgnify:CR=1 FL=1